jgi:transcription elongation factor
MLISSYEMNLLRSILEIELDKLFFNSDNLTSSIGIFLIIIFLYVRLCLCKT